MAGVFASALYGSDGNPGPTTGASANGYSQAATNAVSARLPRFLDFNPELWFAQCEAVFELSRITAERTKFNHCVSCLEPEVLRKVQAVIRAPDPDAPYSSFKEALLRATTKSLPQRVQEVMDLRLGDRRPSDLLHLMEESWPEGEADGSPVAVEEVSGVLNGSHKECTGSGHATVVDVGSAVPVRVDAHAQKDVGAHKGGSHGHGFGQHDD
ncbi:hypothetical protein TCAL_16952 [Tigriopus californicus]|uniref:DUF7041 domain-containing protein n=1 Tax=Tigriopus californicus TaxID=6832 RepID=A0A553NQ14_TIGCA|nr:hypothetical protein TCAL_16952 [Tigriopus californicus]